jgi:hypothetical protein
MRYGKNTFDLVFKILVHQLPGATEEKQLQ